MSDQSLVAAVMQALADNPVVHPDEIAVMANDQGDVHLRGTVGGLLQRTEAVRAARSVPGVRTVDDELRVRPLGVDGRVDADTRAAVFAALTADDRVGGWDIDVEARDGAITLLGSVELPSQRDRAERVALAVGGVKSVDNHLRILLPISADDVAERVTNALGADALVGLDDITVSVADEDVTLSGVVVSAEHRRAALAAAADVPGVARVHDALHLRPTRETSA